MLSFPKTGQKGKRFSTVNAPNLNKLRSKVLLFAIFNSFVNRNGKKKKITDSCKGAKT